MPDAWSRSLSITSPQGCKRLMVRLSRVALKVEHPSIPVKGAARIHRLSVRPLPATSIPIVDRVACRRGGARRATRDAAGSAAARRGLARKAATSFVDRRRTLLPER